MLEKILRIDELMEISNFIMERKYDVSGLSINMKVDKETIKRIGEDYLYRYNKEKEAQFDDSIKEINFNIGGVVFKYYCD